MPVPTIPFKSMSKACQEAVRKAAREALPKVKVPEHSPLYPRTTEQMLERCFDPAKKAPLRQFKDRIPNKTEQRFRDHHESVWGGIWHYEAVSLRLPSGTLYTCDWMVEIAGQRPVFVECKAAFIHRDASTEKLKAARKAFGCFRFLFAQYKAKQWHYAGESPNTNQHPGEGIEG